MTLKISFWLRISKVWYTLDNDSFYVRLGRRDNQNAIVNKFSWVKFRTQFPSPFLLGLALVGDGLDGFLDGLLVAEELHRDHGLHLGVQLVHEGDPWGQTCKLCLTMLCNTLRKTIYRHCFKQVFKQVASNRKFEPLFTKPLWQVLSTRRRH